jgi:hypothetical protein
LFGVLSVPAAELKVVHLQAMQAAAELTAPVITLQDLMM